MCWNNRYNKVALGVCHREKGEIDNREVLHVRDGSYFNPELRSVCDLSNHQRVVRFDGAEHILGIGTLLKIPCPFEVS